MTTGAREARILRHQLGDLVAVLEAVRAMLAGGAVTALFSTAAPRDYDVYFRDAAGLQHVLDHFVNASGWRQVATTDLTTTFTAEGKPPVQLITAEEFRGEPAELLKHFDFTVCRGIYDFAPPGGFVLGDDFQKHLAQRRLVFVGSAFPICSLVRMLKYLRRGYVISGVELIKIGLTIQHLEIETFADLRRQLMGIDTAFLRELMDKFKGAEYAEKAFELDEFLQVLDDYLGVHAVHLAVDEELP